MLTAQEAATTRSYQWDANGNATRYSTAVAESAGVQFTQLMVTMTWDDENRLLTASDGSTTVHTFTYAADGKRRSKRATYDSVPWGQTFTESEEYVWDEETVLLTTDAAGVTQHRFTHAPGSWGETISQRKGG